MTTWEELCHNKQISELPYKVELNGRGQVIMSPTANYHGNFSHRIGVLLEQHLPDGEVIVECAVETTDGIKEADVAWASVKVWDQIKEDYSSSISPEICVEVLSPSNSVEEMLLKRKLFIGAGAHEYWLCDRKGQLRFFDAIEELPASRTAPGFPRQLPPRR